jgi:NTE family protein
VATSTPATGTTVRAVDLALSRGGARGIVHVGLLEVLDEMHVPVRGVTSTDMGAILAAPLLRVEPL